MIQESFRENGIEFAHRNVTVYMPPDDEAGDHDKKMERSDTITSVTSNFSSL